MGKRVNLAEFVSAGLLNDVDVIVTASAYDQFDYQGKSDPVCAMRWDLQVENDEDEEIQSQYWSVGGSLEDFEPSEDGQFIESVAGRTSLAKGSNYEALIKSLEACGLDKQKLIEEGCAIFDGMRCHVLRVKAPKRNFAAPSVDAQGNPREQEILIVSEVHEFPWDKKGGSSKKKAVKKAAKKASSTTKGQEEESSATGGDEDSDSVAAALAAAALEDGPLSILKLKIKIYGETNDYDMSFRKEVSAKVSDPEWLEAAGFTVKGSNVSMGG